MPSDTVIGIDLGTTYSCVAVYRNGRVEILDSPEGFRTTPSEVAFTEFEQLTGQAAKNQRALNPKNTIFDVKRLIGRKFDDPEVQSDIKNFPFRVSQENTGILVEVEFKGQQKKFTPEQISAMILQKMKDTAEIYLGHEVKKAVITVPACFNDGQRKATKDAARIAGLEVLQIINEPIAAALAFGLKRDTSKKQNILVFDIGGGTFDVSIITAFPGCVFKVKATTRNNHFGGSDFDQILLEHFSRTFDMENNTKITENIRAVRRLQTACEAAKRGLSAKLEEFVIVDSLFGGIDFNKKITRVQFEELCEPLFLKVLVSVEKALSDAKIDKSLIDEIVLVGGTTRIPRVVKILEELFVGKKLNYSKNPDEAVAYGAAVQAAILTGEFEQNTHNQESDIAIGIDLGTTFSCVAVYHNGKIKIISNREGNKKTPSQVAFTDTERLIGDSAETQAVLNPERSFFDVKRLIGRRFDDKNVQSDLEQFPFKIVKKESNIALEAEFKKEHKQFAPEQISSMMIQEMKNTAWRQLGLKVRNAVITVPANFNDRQRQATKDAAEIAGLKVLHLLNEPTAAVLAYAYDRGVKQNQKLLIFDFGGGTLDVSIATLKLDSNRNLSLEVNATAGDTHLGGTDFDRKMLEYFSKMFNEEYGVDVTNNARSMKRLRVACENAKKILSTNTKVPINIDSLFEGRPFNFLLTQNMFESVCSDLFQRIIAPVEKVLKDSETKKEEVKEIFLVGGSTRIPKVRQILQNFFGRKVLNNFVNPDEAVAYGAAVQAAILSGVQVESLRGLTLRDVTSWNYFAGSENFTVKLINEGSSIAIEKLHIFSNPPGKRLRLIVNEKKLPMGVFEIGTLEVFNNESSQSCGACEVEISFKVNEDGILTVSAVDEETKKEKLVVFDKGRISSYDIERMAEENEIYEIEEKLHLEKLEPKAKNKLEEYVKEIEDWTLENTPKLSEAEFEIMTTAMNKSEEWIADAEQVAIESYYRKIKSECDKIMEKHN